SCVSIRPAPTDPSPLSLHDALPIWHRRHELGEAKGPVTRDAEVDVVLAHQAEVAVVVADEGVDGTEVRERAAHLGRHVRRWPARSEEHTSELQSLTNLVCRLLLEKK